MIPRHRVMTVSFHRYGLCFDHLGAYPFFPGTGELHDVGERHGKNYSVNVPLKARAVDTRCRLPMRGPCIRCDAGADERGSLPASAAVHVRQRAMYTSCRMRCTSGKNRRCHGVTASGTIHTAASVCRCLLILMIL